MSGENPSSLSFSDEYQGPLLKSMFQIKQTITKLRALEGQSQKYSSPERNILSKPK